MINRQTLTDVAIDTIHGIVKSNMAIVLWVFEDNHTMVIRINDNVSIRLMPTNHLPPRLRRILQRQKDSNTSKRSGSALPPVEEPASSPAISRAKSNAITQPPSPRRRKNRRSREKENYNPSPIALKWCHRTRTRPDHCTTTTTTTTHTTID
ncbi:hypothetical protein BDR04DRAFT_1087835 [Suillus decipiens]|nr:hypothetical protein BDR04DRAFT_1087835 [Suillus decipiens]